MDFFNGIISNSPFIPAIIIIIQVLKGVLKRQGKNISDDTWKVVVIILGLPMALIMSVINGFVGSWWLAKIFNVIVLSVIYSAVASLIYQSGKLVFKNSKELE